MNYNSTLLWVQHWAKIQYTEPDCYNVSNSDYTSVWDTGYATLIADLDAVIASEKSTDTYNAVAGIWRAWVLLQLTNLFGDIPYTEEGQSVTPAYDTQETILRGLLESLESDAQTLAASSETISGDLIYDGDLGQWVKFAHSLRLRIALEIADRDASTAQTILSHYQQNRSLLITDVSDNAQFVFTASPQWNPWASAFSSRDDQRVSKTLVDKLKELSDPRLPIYAQLPQDSTVTTYEGGANGLSASDANSQGFYKLSRAGPRFLEDSAPAVFFTAAETYFTLAEAAARGLAGGDAETYYTAAITASLEQYDVSDSDISAYLGQAAVAWDAANWAEQLGWQKWISLYGQAPDAFTDWRRLGYPELVAGPAAVLDNGALPRRLFYPSTEQSLNGANYTNAVANQGADELTTRLWFDVEDKQR